MHELSLSYATVETALESIRHLEGVTRIKSIKLRHGELSGVALDAFRFSFPIAAEGTPLQDAELLFEAEPVTVYCKACDRVGRLADIRRFRCPHCDEPTGDVRSGKEFTIQSLEVEVPEVDHANC
jgi:hydrogenase nickel incorporation protein HypA/HybF